MKPTKRAKTTLARFTIATVLLSMVACDATYTWPFKQGEG